MKDSNIFGVSVRAWALLLVLSTVCCMSMLNMKVGEPLYTLVGLICGFYFGRSQGKQEGKENAKSE